MENNSFMKTLFKVILGGVIIYFVYNLIFKKKMKIGDFSFIDGLKGLEDKLNSFSKNLK
jgi:hypothetical protein